MAKEIFFTIKGDSGQAVKSIKELEDEIKRLQKEWKAAEDPIVRNKISSSLKNAKAELKSFNDSLKDGQTFAQKISAGITDSFGKLGKVVAGAFVTKEIINFGGETVKAFGDAEQAALKLQNAVSSTGGLQSDFDRLISQSETLTNTTIFSDDDIQAIQTAALQFGLTADEVEKLTPVITDFASATGQDLNSALGKVIGGLNGQTKGLKEYGVTLNENLSIQERFTTIIDQLNDKFKGQAEVLGQTTLGALDKLKNSWDNLKETIGSFISPFVSKIADFATNTLNAANASETLESKINSERIALNVLVTQIINAAEGTKRRKELIDELQQKYPKFLDNLNTEKLTNEELAKQLKLVNQQYINKALLAGKQAEVDEKGKIAGEALSRVYKTEQEILKIATEKGLTNYINAKAPLAEQAKQLQAALLLQNKELQQGTINTTDNAKAIRDNNQTYLRLGTLILDATNATEDYKTASEDLEFSVQGLVDFQQRFGEETKKTTEDINLQNLSLNQLKNKKKELEGATGIKNKDLLDQIDAEIKKREELAKKQKENNKKIADDNEKRAEESAKLEEQIYEQDWANKLAKAKDGQEKINLEIQKLQEDQIRINEKIKEEEIKKQNAKDEKQKEVIQKRIDLLTKQKENIPILITIKENEKNQKVFDDIEKRNKEQLETEKNNIETSISLLETKLLSVKKNSKEEFQIKKELEAKKKDLEIVTIQSSIKNYEDKIKAGKQLNDQELSEYKLLQQQLIQANAEKNNAIENQDKNSFKAKFEAFQKEAQNVLKYAQPIADAITTIINAQNEAEQARIDNLIQLNEKQKEIRLAQLDEQYQAEKGLYGDTIALQKTFEKNRLKIEQEAENKRKALALEAWQKDKNAKIQTAIINTALAVTNALATTTPFALALITAAAAGISGAVQINAIKSTPPPVYQEGGILSGPSHSEGGIPLGNRNGIIAEAEGGEIILNKNVSRNPRLTAIASAINQSTGGRSFSNSYDPIASAIMRNNSFQKGGIVRPIQSFANGGVVSSISVAEFANLNETLNRIDQRLSTPPRAYVIEQDITQTQNLNALIERRSKIL